MRDNLLFTRKFTLLHGFLYKTDSFLFSSFFSNFLQLLVYFKCLKTILFSESFFVLLCVYYYLCMHIFSIPFSSLFYFFIFLLGVVLRVLLD